MKNFFKSIGKAAIYFVVYIVAQAIVSFAYGIMFAMELMAAGETTDAAILTEQLTNQILDNAMEMTFFAGVLTLIIYWIRFAVRKKKLFKEVEIKKISINGLLPISLMALSFNAIISMVLTYFPWPQEWIDAYATNSAPLDGSIMSWITAVVMAPVLEEVVFRGLVYTRLKKGMPTIVAAILASLLFGLCHGTAIWIIYATVLGMVMIWVFERYQSLTASILFHFTFNAMGLVINMIPESMEFVLWILFAASVVGMVYGVKETLKVTMREKREQVQEVGEVYSN